MTAVPNVTAWNALPADLEADAEEFTSGGIDLEQQRLAASNGHRATAASDTSPAPDGATTTGPHPSWQPTTIGHIMRGLSEGTVERPTPTVGVVAGAQEGILYPGRINGIFGKSGESKSWIAQVIAAQEVQAGRRVWWIDFEDTNLGAADRLVALGLDPDDVDERFRYVQPTVVLDLVTTGWLINALHDDKPTLVVVDSTGEWMGLDGIETHRDEKVARWFQTCARPLCVSGAAVALIDHLPHDAQGRLAPIGSVRKVNAIDGGSYLVEAVVEFGRGRAGKSRLIVAKDRLGWRTRGSIAAWFSLDAREHPYIAALEAPGDHHDTHDGPLAGEKPAVRRVWAALEAGPADTRELGDRLATDGAGPPLKRRTIQDACAHLRDLHLAQMGDSESAYRWARAHPPNEEATNGS